MEDNQVGIAIHALVLAKGIFTGHSLVSEPFPTQQAMWKQESSTSALRTWALSTYGTSVDWGRKQRQD